MSEQQPIQFRNNYGTINQNNHKPEQSKDVIKQFRLEPDAADKIKDLCFDKNITFSDFMRKATLFTQIYYDHIDTLLTETKTFVPLAERLSKKF